MVNIRYILSPNGLLLLRRNHLLTPPFLLFYILSMFYLRLVNILRYVVISSLHLLQVRKRGLEWWAKGREGSVIFC